MSSVLIRVRNSSDRDNETFCKRGNHRGLSLGVPTGESRVWGPPRLGAWGLRSESGIGGLMLEIWQRRHWAWGAVLRTPRPKVLGATGSGLRLESQDWRCRRPWPWSSPSAWAHPHAHQTSSRGGCRLGHPAALFLLIPGRCGCHLPADRHLCEAEQPASRCTSPRGLPPTQRPAPDGSKQACGPRPDRRVEILGRRDTGRAEEPLFRSQGTGSRNRGGRPGRGGPGQVQLGCQDIRDSRTKSGGRGRGRHFPSTSHSLSGLRSTSLWVPPWGR